MRAKTFTSNLPAIDIEGSLSNYLTQIKKFPMLSAKEEYMLAKSWKNRGDLKAAQKVSKSIVKKIGAKEVDSTDDVGSVSIVGTGMTSSPGYAATMFEALYNEKVNIEIISTSEIRITCVVKRSNVTRSVKALHNAFKLDVE